MPEQSPEYVAAASLSPLSPAPVPIQTTVVSKLLDQAATADAAAANPFTPPSVSHRFPAMASNTETAEISDTIVVGGDYSDESHDDSDDSIDYGEGEEGQEQERIEPDAANDDYARTFDSPAAHEDQSEVEVDEAQPDVSMASESMNSPSAPDPLTSQTPAAAVPSSDHPSPPPGLAPTNGPAQGTSEPSEHADLSESPSEFPSAAPNASPSPAAPAMAAPAEQTPAAPSPIAAQVAAAAAAEVPASANEDGAAVVDIQKLVDDITARAAATASPSKSPVQATPATTQAAPAPLTVPHPPSLPPKPSLPPPPATLPAIPQPHHSFQSRGPNGSAHPAVSMNIASPGAPPGTYTIGHANEGISSLPQPPPAAYGVPPNRHAHLPNAHHMPGSGDAPGYHASSVKQLWDQFQADEKRYTSEAKWERFPEGSRIFIGNLSSERVTKREVFDVFHQFGRLAQISLKNAYGFVQYHTIDEGNAAMQAAQGIELGGRRIHLEISRAQKKKDDRERSPDHRTPRGGPRGNERFETGERGYKRDDYRPPVRSPSPRRNGTRGSRDGLFSRDREFSAGYDRRRSRSPPRHNRHGEQSYRHRSPSPHRRAPSDGGRFDLPRRFGADVPDVQILLTQEVSRDFVAWVQGAFHNRGLRTDVMYINPRFPRDTVVQRQVVEGVHAIIDLDYTAQSQGKIPVQVFIRSGATSVRFEMYQGIDPPVAAELVLREKSQSAAQAQAAQAQAAQAAQARPSYAPTQYNQPYPTEAPPAAYPYQQYSQPAAPPTQHQPPPVAPDLANMVGQLDNNALQALLASLQNPQPGARPHPGMAHPGVPHAGGAPQAPQIDMNALLGNLRSAAAAQPAPVPNYGAAPAYASPVAAAPHGAHHGMAGAGFDTTQQVQTIIDQLKRAAQ